MGAGKIKKINFHELEILFQRLRQRIIGPRGQGENSLFSRSQSNYGEGPYDISVVEGSIATHHDIQRLRDVGRLSGRLNIIGACAMSQPAGRRSETPV